MNLILDLNCDLGEGEAKSQTVSMLQLVSSCNIACGGHAGTVDSILHCLQLCRKFGVKAGAHPGPVDPAGKGRVAQAITRQGFETSLMHQISAFAELARFEKVSMHHVKLHGAWYHLVESNRSLAKSFIQMMQKHWPKSPVYCRAGGRFSRQARDHGLPVWEEAFADRAYLPNGELVPRHQAGALLSGPSRIAQQAWEIILRGEVTTQDGSPLQIRPKTMCLHIDTPGILVAARKIRQRLETAGNGVEPKVAG